MHLILSLLSTTNTIFCLFYRKCKFRTENEITFAVRTGCISIVKKLATKENVFLSDETSLCPYQISYQHENIHEFLKHLTKQTDESQYSELKDWYKRVRKSNTMYTPSIKNAMNKTETELFLEQSVLFADIALCSATQELFDQLLSFMKLCSNEMSQNKNYAFLQFTPMQSGSIREKTKTFTPNEGDITCVVDDTTGLKILDESKSQSTIKVNREVANRGWVELCLDNFILCPKLLSAFLREC